MPVKLKSIIDVMDRIAPPRLALDFDNPGLMVGDAESDISTVMVALDIDDDVCNEAADKDVQLIITHHPLIYHPIKNLDAANPKGRILRKLIANNINVYSAHTNLDAAENGTNGYLADRLNLRSVRVLQKTYGERMYKVAVYVPVGYEDRVRKAMIGAGAGSAGKYSGCTFNMSGEGQFMPLQGSSPFIGDIGSIAHARETKIETMASEGDLKNVVDAMLKAHPYQEAAYDIYELKNDLKEYGIGRVGYLDPPISLGELSENVKRMLGIDSVNVIGDLRKTIHKAAVCSGNGSDFIGRAYDIGCDAYITGDIGYHDGCDARDMDLAIIDGGHFGTENVFMGELVRILRDSFEQRGLDLNVMLSDTIRSPFTRV